MKGLHCHFSEVEYGLKGEIKHHPLGSKWGPSFRLLAKVIKANGYVLVMDEVMQVLEPLESDIKEVQSLLTSGVLKRKLNRMMRILLLG